MAARETEKAARLRDAGGDLQKIEMLGGGLDIRNSQMESGQQAICAAVVLDRERIRDGARRGQPTARFTVELVDAKGATVVWRGFTYDGALKAASEWTARGAQLQNRYAQGALAS